MEDRIIGFLTLLSSKTSLNVLNELVAEVFLDSIDNADLLILDEERVVGGTATDFVNVEFTENWVETANVVNAGNNFSVRHGG